MKKFPVSSGSSDEELMQAVRLGDAYAFELLYRRYKTPIISFTCRMVQNYQKAEDLTQDIFLRILKKKKSYDVSKKFSGWLYRIASNTCIDELRRLKFTGPAPEFEQESAPGDAGGNVPSEIEKSELQALIKKALNKLPKEQKTLVILHKYQNLKYEEIADVFNKDFNWVKWQLKTAYDSLENELRPYFK